MQLSRLAPPIIANAPSMLLAPRALPKVLLPGTFLRIMSITFLLSSATFLVFSMTFLLYLAIFEVSLASFDASLAAFSASFAAFAFFCISAICSVV
jgi:hypothetical protein